jgi:predicted nucleotidyltransferase
MAQMVLSKDGIHEFCRKWKITEFGLFGSVRREDFRPDSDLDVMVSFAPDAHWSLTDLVEMQAELEGAVGHKVDLVERSAIERSENYIRRRHILSFVEPVYLAR